MIDHPDEQLLFAGVGGPLRRDDVLFCAEDSNRIAPLQVVRHDRVVGPDHLRSAARHALRAQAEGRMQARTLEVEFVRYLAGERQIRHALDKMGLPETAPAAVVVALGPKRRDAVQHFLHAMGAATDDTAWAPSEEKLASFGISAAALEATPPGHRLDLVLEAVAAVDLLK